MSAQLVLVIAVVLFIVLLVVIRLWLNRLEEKGKLSEELLEVIKMLQTGSKEDRKVLLQSLQKNTQALNERLDNAAKIIGGVQRSIGEFSEIGRSMKELQDFLQSPKLRGNIGEQILKDLLSQYFPKDSFKLQYTFKNGEKVDAILKTSAGLIPIDSKFPMENYRRILKESNPKEKERLMKEFVRDVKKHIQDISKKYISVSEGTVDYALMYVPSEAVFYEIINSSEVFDYSGYKRVIPVSPMSFYAFLRSILMSMEGQRIQAKAREILEILQAIKKDYEKTDDALSILTKHITNAYNQLAQVGKNFMSLGQKIQTTRLLGSEEKQERLLEEDLN
ncbi:DNA recombination protein RmuC [Candidatus Roizmanbacteria bacterium]|nr:DNA recombination protein RmuC [Candidatus Roizmanbacteria bacterium]